MTTVPNVMRESAAALADRSLQDAVESFLAAHAEAEEAWLSLSRAQISGPDPVSPQAEFLLDEAQCRWDLLAAGWAEHLIPAEAREAGKDYARPKIRHVAVVQTAPVDWSKGRAA